METLDPYQQTCITILIAFMGVFFLIVLVMIGIGVWSFIESLLDERKFRKKKNELKKKIMEGERKCD